MIVAGRSAAGSSAGAVGPLLGGLSPAAFLRAHWQKRPLLVRQAIPGFRGIVSRDAFLALATRDDARSRLVIHHPRRAPARRWERHDGPFGALAADMLPARGWTLLVNSVESLIPGGWEILRRFSFLPAARIDDLMISYAADGGSVGPHDDLYDVFLLQGPGRRRWQVSRQRDRARRSGRGDQGAAVVRARGGVGAGAGRHAVPAAGRRAPRRRRGAVLHVFDRLHRACRTPICTAASSATSARCWGRTSIRARSTRTRI